MKKIRLYIFITIIISSCAGHEKPEINQEKKNSKVQMVTKSKIEFIETHNLKFNEESILRELDLAYQGTPSDLFPKPKDNVIVYNFFMDLENGYMSIANSKIHLFADENKWAIVFETNGYHNRQFNSQIDLVYIGNCISYPVMTYPENSYISNVNSIELISEDEFKRIQNNTGNDMENFELIHPEVKEIKVRDELIPINYDITSYEKKQIKIREYDNPKKLIGFQDLVRYLSDANKDLMSATEEEIRAFIPSKLPKLMTIDSFHQESNYEGKKPSSYSTYKLIAKILVTKDTSLWQPKLAPNNHWINWESGGL